LRLNAFAGSTLRGGFGHIFKSTICIWPPGDCPRCLLKNTCAYPYIFETAPPPGSEKLRNLDQIPRPFVIEPPEFEPALNLTPHSAHSSPRAAVSCGATSIIARHVGAAQSINDPTTRLSHGVTYKPNDCFEFGLVLIGRAIDSLPYFLFTFIELGRVGLGPSRGRCTVLQVDADRPDGCECIYTHDSGVLADHQSRIAAADIVASAEKFAPSNLTRGASPFQHLDSAALTVRFLTPTRIRSSGDFRMEITFQDLIRALLRRLSSLCYFHCGGELKVDFKGLIEQAAAVRTVNSNLRWQRQDRVSGRQHRRIEMGGVIGSVTFAASNEQGFVPFLPLLTAGEWVHVGKGCVMGLGKFRVEVPA